jgi:hypothetical protein
MSPPRTKRQRTLLSFLSNGCSENEPKSTSKWITDGTLLVFPSDYQLRSADKSFLQVAAFDLVCFYRVDVIPLTPLIG